MESWHSLSSDRVLELLDSGTEGLQKEEAQKRLEETGPNSLDQARSEGVVRRLLRQFHDILIYILLIAAGLTAYLGEWIETGVIVAVVVINAVIGFVQEGKAEEALEMIRQLLSQESTVIRGGQRQRINAEALVPGDVVWLESGDRVPADVRLLSIQDLAVEEALLTGESEPVQKATRAVDEQAPLADRVGMAYSGTVVVRGTAKAVVVATGSDTEVGQIGEMVAQVERLKTPLIRKIDRFGLWLSGFILLASVVIFLFGWSFRPYAVTDLFMLVVSLAVAAIPEGLPAIMTIILALGVRRMAERNAIVRQLPAVETLGSVTVICSDKTGTLTRNEMSARRVLTATDTVTVTGEANDPTGQFCIDGSAWEVPAGSTVARLARAAALCNDAQLSQTDDGTWTIEGDPTEGALVVLAARAGVEKAGAEKRYPRRDAIPFESDRRYMATLNDGGEEGRFVFLKGAPERVLAMCDRQATESGEEPLDREYWQSQSDMIADDGYRLLAIAARCVDDACDEIRPESMSDEFVMLGMVGLMDPPRDEAIAAVAQAQQAGIRVKMITGDHGKTARSIGEKMNIGRGRPAITGRELEDADDEQLMELACEHDVFARTSPEHKLRIVEALQRHHEIVAMTGDGVNDAPALKRADVGVAMGIKGTEATKQAADMVLADDNFASIERAIHEGRTIYDNLKKTILFLLPTNGAEALMLLAAVVLALEYFPITPVQILWVNMITAVTLALALAFEPAEEGIMSRPPRPVDEPIIGRYAMGRIAVVAVLIGSLSLASFFGARADGLSVELARTLAVNVLVAGQLFYLFSSRFLVEPSYTRRGLFGNPVALGAAGVLVGFQLIFTYVPIFQTWFSTEGLHWHHWLWVLGVGITVFLIVEFEKAVMRRWRQRHDGDKGSAST